MRNDPQRSRGTRLASMLISARADQVSRGRATWRRSPASWWAKHKDLGILCRRIRPEDKNGLKSAPGQTVEQGQGDQGSLAERVSTGQTRLGGSGPFRLPCLLLLLRPGTSGRADR